MAKFNFADSIEKAKDDFFNTLPGEFGVRITARLFFHFKKYAPQGGDNFGLDPEPGATAGDVLNNLGVPEDAAKVLLINGRQAKAEDVLHEGDFLVLFPPLEGG